MTYVWLAWAAWAAFSCLQKAISDILGLTYDLIAVLSSAAAVTGSVRSQTPAHPPTKESACAGNLCRGHSAACQSGSIGCSCPMHPVCCSAEHQERGSFCRGMQISHPAGTASPHQVQIWCRGLLKRPMHVEDSSNHASSVVATQATSAMRSSRVMLHSAPGCQHQSLMDSVEALEQECGQGLLGSCCC